MAYSNNMRYCVNFYVPTYILLVVINKIADTLHSAIIINILHNTIQRCERIVQFRSYYTDTLYSTV